jgi:hypothetical protein
MYGSKCRRSVLWECYGEVRVAIKESGRKKAAAAGKEESFYASLLFLLTAAAASFLPL